MKLSKLIKAFGIFALATSGKLLPEAKADYTNFTVCNDFQPPKNATQDLVTVLVGELDPIIEIQPLGCEEIDADVVCMQMKPDLKTCNIYSLSSITGEESGMGEVQTYDNGALNLVHGHTNLISCVGTVNDKTFAVYPADNGVCLPVIENPLTQQPPRLQG